MIRDTQSGRHGGTNTDSESHLRAVLETVIDGVITINAEGIIQTINPATVRIFGYIAEEMLGKNIKMLMPEPYSGEHDGYLHNYLTTGVKKVIGIGREVIGKRKDGSTFPMELAVSEMDVGGERMFTGIVRDITKRKQAEINSARFAAIVASSEDAIMSKALNGIVTSWNAAAERLFGYSESEMIGAPMTTLFPPDRLNEEPQILDQIRAGERIEHFETVRVKKDGTHVDVSVTISPIKDVAGEIVGASKIVRDITDRKRAEAELQSRENRIRALVETILDGIIVIDAKGLVQTLNPAAVTLFGYTSEEVQGKNIKMLMPEPYSGEHDGYLHNYLTTGVKKVIGIGREVIGKRKDGSTFPMELAVNEMDVGGERMFTGIVRDISERKRVETMKAEFISTVSHELRTPLTSIRGALSLVLGKVTGELPEQAQRMLEMAARNSERLSMLINDILDLEKLEADRLEFEFKNIDLVNLAGRALEDNEGFAGKHKIRLVLDRQVTQAPVWADEHRLLQVFANLISNAVKYSPENGAVTVAVAAQNEGFRVAVRDCGAGIPEEFRKRIFQRFAQADSSDAREKGGTGLGLSITKAIVERHDGRIGYDSKAGEGAVFYFDLPARHAVTEAIG